MAAKVLATLLVLSILLNVSKPVQSQQVLDGANVNSTLIKSSSYKILYDEVSKRTESQKPTTPPLFSCLDLDICRTGLDFCNERRKACEKCEDYQRTCGTNLQPVNCTQYCVGLLVKERCQANVAIKQTATPMTTGELSETKMQTNTPDSVNKPGYVTDWKLIIIGILVFIVILSVVFNIYCIRRLCRSKYKDLTDEMDPLMSVCCTGPPSEDPIIIDVISSQYSSVPPNNDNSGRDSVQPSASVAPPESPDREQTTVKEGRTNHKYVPSRPHETDIGEQKRCSRRNAEEDLELKNIRAEVQGQEVDNDKSSTSGYSSSSTPSRAGTPVINNNINITLNGLPNLISVMPTEVEMEASQPGNIGKEAPYSVQETYDNDKSSSSENFVVNDHARTQNQKPVSDENNCTKIALENMSVDMDNLKKCFKQDTSL